MVEIKTLKNAYEALDRDPTAVVSRFFIMRDHMASSERLIGNPTGAI